MAGGQSRGANCGLLVYLARYGWYAAVVYIRRSEKKRPNQVVAPPLAFHIGIVPDIHHLVWRQPVTKTS